MTGGGGRPGPRRNSRKQPPYVGSGDSASAARIWRCQLSSRAAVATVWCMALFRSPSLWARNALPRKLARKVPGAWLDLPPEWLDGLAGISGGAPEA